MVKQINLRPRLALIAQKIPKTERLIDIGADHALLPIAAIASGTVKAAVAVDIKSGPLEKAERNIRIYGFENAINAVLSDGLENIPVKSGDAVVMAGMGGELIACILERSVQSVKNVKALIIQPMTEDFKVREWIYNNGFSIYDEDLVEDNGKIYIVISSRPLPEPEPLPEFAAFTGTILQNRRDQPAKRYFERIKNRYTKIRDHSGKKKSSVIYAVDAAALIDSVQRILNKMTQEV